MAGAVVSSLASPLFREVRIKRSRRPLTDHWRSVPVEPRASTLLGVSFRPRQAEALGLDPEASLQTLLAYPFQIIRLGAYWNRIEPEPCVFVPDELDRQVDAAEAAGKQIILCVGAVKTFGYPEFFVPAHQLSSPLREGRLVEPDDHRSLLSGVEAFVTRIVERYRNRKSIVAWQVEHEAVDPLGMEHSWRLAQAFVQEEVEAVRTADPSRPIMMNGFLATSAAVGLQQWWRTRDQGDSMAVAQNLADIVGVDYYPRHALVSFGEMAVYLNGSRGPWARRRYERLPAHGRTVMICEGQAEPWEAVTTPPSPLNPTADSHQPIASMQVMYSCMPEHVVENYNRCMSWIRAGASPLHSYLFWGAEYWLLRQQQGDNSYVGAFARVLEKA